MVVMDFGGIKHGYRADTTRTVHVGEPTTRSVRCSRSSGPAGRLRGGAPGGRLPGGPTGAARKVMADAGYGDKFFHRVGHGIGLTTHEPPKWSWVRSTRSKAVQHGGHVDYVVGGHLHHPDGDHCDDHGPAAAA
jgi:hypothetical protein